VVGDQRHRGRALDAVVVGAGLAGLYMLHRLRGAGFSVRVFEAGDGVGGTWYWNRYPGARVDVKSMEYSYSFSPELEQDWEWSEKYPPQPEVLRYVEHVADRFDLRRDIHFSTRVVAAAFDEAADVWEVRTDRGDRVRAQYLIMATGCLSAAKLPEVPGRDTFAGPTFHTGHWPPEGVDFTGQRVGVIGTGSSAVQSIPLIAERAAALTVFQRTPNFVLPAHNHPIDPGHQREVKARYRELREKTRRTRAGILADPPTKSALEVDDAERTARFTRAWTDPDNSLVDLTGSYTDLLLDRDANDTAAQFVRDRIAEIVDDPDTAAALQPTDYPIGTKRVCLGTNYYETYNLPHVRLVDLKKTPIVEITPAGVRTSDEEVELDALVFATGFDALTGPLLAVDIRGRGGVALADKWAEGPRTFLGLSVAGFPNLFTITGPGSPSVLSNMIVSIEQHVDWIADAVTALRGRGVRTIEATPDAEDTWTRTVDENARATLYPTANSWYMGANVPGKPRVFLPFIGGLPLYREACDEVAANDYRGFVLRG
jgi:cation diffusion facilitator CzcD-associated flavoprotein CzcO